MEWIEIYFGINKYWYNLIVIIRVSKINKEKILSLDKFLILFYNIFNYYV